MNYNLLIIKKNLTLDPPYNHSTHDKRMILSLKGTKIVGGKKQKPWKIKKIPLLVAIARGDTSALTKLLKVVFAVSLSWLV
jgi:hypothetical protein